jgi:protocatechuate 3,4-dioxygenase beta subunit
MDNDTSEARLTRRYLLAGLGAGAAVLLGCSDDSADSLAAPGSTGSTGSTGSSGSGTSSTTGPASTSSSSVASSGSTTSAAQSGAATTAAPATTLAPTPACDDGDDPTPAQTEGPFFTPSSPLKASFLGDVSSGTRLALSGTVVTTACTPVRGALVDLWQADDDGEYDNAGYRLRGHQVADDRGNWAIETIVPGLYTGRTRHLHVKVQAPGGRVLTTQLYFPGEAANARDGIFREECLLGITADGNGQRGTFTFVLDA